MTALHLYANNITSLNALSFMNLPSLNLLNLASNQIVNIHRQAFLNVPNLRYLYLSENRIDKVSFDWKTLNIWNFLVQTYLSSQFKKTGISDSPSSMRHFPGDHMGINPQHSTPNFVQGIREAMFLNPNQNNISTDFYFQLV